MSWGYFLGVFLCGVVLSIKLFREVRDYTSRKNKPTIKPFFPLVIVFMVLGSWFTLGWLYGMDDLWN